MPKSELNVNNYKRIFGINCLLIAPLLAIFAWPYLVFCDAISLTRFFTYPGAILFSLPFTLTILHGHVTLALGSVHRHHYYQWLQENPLTYGLLYNGAFSSTRFRLVLFAISIILFVIGWLLKI